MFSKILAIFLTWRIGLFVVAFLATIFLPTFGSRFPYSNQVLKITGLPAWVWGFGNFDGVHYLRIAQNGYNAEYSQAFFPMYPLFIRFFTNLNPFIHKDPMLDTSIYVDPSYFFTGLILSNIFFLLALILFYKLIRIDFNLKVAFGSLFLLAAFPASFYFGSIYTESLFLFLVLGAIYFARKGNFLVGGVFSAFASATRIFGLLLVPVLLIEAYLKFKKGKIVEKGEPAKAVVGILLAPFGTLLYMLFLRLNFNNPVYFLTSQPLFGAERSAENLIFLPQVFYRYLKIFITVPLSSQLFFNAFLEFSFTIAVLAGVLLFFKKIRISYLVFTLGCLILPTLTGTLSSMPRYSLLGFLLLPLIVQSADKYYKWLLGFSIAVGIVLTMLFVRGYWVA